MPALDGILAGVAVAAEDLDRVRMGAYRAGSDPAVDEALLLGPRIETLLRQDRAEQTNLDVAFQLLREVLAAS